MGKILKTEFIYNITGILIGYCIVGLAFIVGLNGEMDNIYGIMSVAFVTFFISIGIMGSESDKEKRERFLTSLPIPLQQYSIVRLLFVIFYQFGMFLILLLFYLLKITPETVSIFWDIVTVNSFALILISFFIIGSDLKFFRAKYYTYIFWIVMLSIAALLILGMVYRILPPFVVIGQDYPKTFSDAVIFNIIFMIIYFVCYIVYNKRNSYLS